MFASEMQEQEVGDGTNFVIIMAGALLEQAEYLLKMVSSFDYFTFVCFFDNFILFFVGFNSS